MRWLLSASALGAVLQLGCADGVTLAARPADDPSNPNAPEAKAPPAPSISAGPSAAPPSEPAPAGHHHQHGGTP